MEAGHRAEAMEDGEMVGIKIYYLQKLQNDILINPNNSSKIHPKKSQNKTNLCTNKNIEDCNAKDIHQFSMRKN